MRGQKKYNNPYIWNHVLYLGPCEDMDACTYICVDMLLDLKVNFTTLAS